MRGKLLNYDFQASEGIISGDDGQRYRFPIAEWRDTNQPMAGQTVDFEANGTDAAQIFKVAGQNPLATGEKNKFVAALLAFFLGGIGAHKFYLGYNTPGIIMAALFVGGWLTSWLLIGILPLLAVGLIAFVECVIYLVTPEDEFQRKYVDNERPWF